MRTCLIAVAGVLLSAASLLAWAQTEEKLVIAETYEGTVGKEDRPALKTGFVADEIAWKKVWLQVNAKEKLPEVDFTRDFLLISTQDAADPNRRSTSVVKDEKGVVAVEEISTLIGFDPSDQTIYRFHKVPRAGVTGVRRFDAETKKAVVDPLTKGIEDGS